ncbi:MAG: polysaccharide deacetylase family protein [Chitinophagaceae bacterium]|jgi:peptidoglycan/xylan/chitin deacetylase (PgdA/CDA1 family)|nr:polysaccharide deacetylase family protein [Chitinophagaceae bacterium]
MLYLIKTPWWLKKMYSGCIWDIKTDEKKLYLTFDDGPDPFATPFVLEQLKKYNAKATFFCIGKNVKEYFNLYSQMIEEGHKPGNHTYDHLNGWHTKDREYLENIAKAKQIIDSKLFRPPYGKISKFQLAQLKADRYKLKTIMWSVLSGDFDNKISAENCFLNVTRNAKAGSIIVFHDSKKCFAKIQMALPKVLQYFSEKGFQFNAINDRD